MLSQLAEDRRHCSNLSPWSGVWTSFKGEGEQGGMCNVAGQGLIGGFWKLASYGIGSRGKIQRNSSWAEFDWSVPYSSIFDQGTIYSLLKDLTICIGLWWPHFCSVD